MILSDIRDDVRYTFRMLWKRPGFTTVACIALALGAGATTALFSVVNAVVLRPLPYPRSDRVVRLVETNPFMRGPGGVTFSLDHFRTWREANQVFASMAAYNSQLLTLTGVEEPVQLTGTSVSPALFAVLGVPPALGRALTADDEMPGQERVVVLSQGAWRKHFGADSTVVGRTIQLDGLPYAVVGIMPPRFEFPDKATEFWTPLVLGPPPDARPGTRAIRVFPVIARLKDGVTREQAESAGRAFVMEIRAQEPGLPAEERESEFRLVTLLEQMVAPVRTGLFILLVAVGLVLLIACANVANLLMARAAERQKEVAVRAALGADKLRLLRQTLTESLVLALLGGALGLVLAYAAVRVLPTVAASSLPRLDEVSVDVSVLLFTLAVSLLTGILFGLAPALESFRVDLIRSLKESGARADRPSRFFPHGRFRSFLVVGEIAVAFFLLVVAGLLLRSFVERIRVDPGYDPQNVVTMTVTLPGYRYAGARSRSDFHRELLDRVAKVPGVQAAGVTNILPLTQANIILSFSIDGRHEPASEEQVPRASFRLVSPGYFKAMGIRLLQGRDFTKADSEGSPAVVIANDALVQKYFPDEDPLGKRMQLGEIVGVVANVRHEGVEAEPRPEFYVSFAQAPSMMSIMMGRMTLVARTSGDPLALLAAIQSQVTALDPELPRFSATTMAERVADSVAQPRFYSLVLVLVAAVALVLAVVGIYGVVSYSVQQRTRETGVRMALGAERRDILKMVVRQGLQLAVLGVTLGSAAALILTRLLKGLLFHVTATDPSTFVGIAILLAAAAVFACYVPARRAAGLDPVVALRYE